MNETQDVKAYAATTLTAAFEGLIALGKNEGVRSLLGGAALTEAAVVAAVKAAFTAAFPVADDAWLSAADIDAVVAVNTDFTAAGTNDVATSTEAVLTALDKHVLGTQSLIGFISQVEAAVKTRAGLAQETLYQRHPIVANIVTAIKRELSLTPPSGTVAGVYAFVDRTRGVWKAPANVSIQGEPAEQIDFFEQEELNVDVTGGKSINAIRSFTGLGTLIWGARTLAGNDNEWRYVPVRRFFNMVEESVKKSTHWAVFEPNDANLWTKVKGMIENYLIQKWRDGALAGATPADAFYVKVGLPLTMTAQDILEGKLIIEIGMAVVRPAEFIILKFSHKMQQS
jgi:phage tail sheath protein FI